MEQFNLEHQYSLYLQRVGVTEATLSASVNRELKRAFMGACGQILIMLRDDLTPLPEDQGVMIMDDLLNQVGSFWTEEMAKEVGS